MSFLFNIKDDGKLEIMRTTTNRLTKGEVIRDALTIYQKLIGIILNGNKIFIGKNRENSYELTMSTIESIE